MKQSENKEEKKHKLNFTTKQSEPQTKHKRRRCTEKQQKQSDSKKSKRLIGNAD